MFDSGGPCSLDKLREFNSVKLVEVERCACKCRAVQFEREEV